MVAFAVREVSQNVLTFVGLISPFAGWLIYHVFLGFERLKESTAGLKADAAEREARLMADADKRDARLGTAFADLKADAAEREARLTALVAASVAETKASEARTEARIINSQQTVRDVTAGHSAAAELAATKAASHAAQAESAAQAAASARAASAAQAEPAKAATVP